MNGTKFEVGDAAYCTAGREKGKIFLVVGFDGEYPLIADGRARKYASPKRKSPVHLKKVAKIKEIAAMISGGMPVGNLRLYRALRTVTKNSGGYGLCQKTT